MNGKTHNKFLACAIAIVLLAAVQANATVIHVGILSSSSGNTISNANAIVAAEFDAGSTVTTLTPAAFNAMTPAQLASSFDVLIAGWAGSAGNDLDWNTRTLPFLMAGGGMIWESPNNVSSGDLTGSGSGASTPGGGTTTHAIVPGNPITTDVSVFNNYHMTYSGWSPAWNPYTTAGGGTITTGLWGEFGSGRIILSGVDLFWHVTGAGDAEYSTIVDELKWTSAAGIPEPGTLVLLLGGIGVLAARRRRA